MASFSEQCRSLHWVLKIGNLKASLDFYENVLGLRVLRHEEFSSGCEATCNGPYGGAWSKTMIGYGPEDNHFALELTYNYGIDSYAFGNDLQFIALQCPPALQRAKALGYTILHGDTIVGPDNYKFKILPYMQGRAEQFVCVALRVADVQVSASYWSGVLGMHEVTLPQNTSLIASGGDAEFTSTSLGYGDSETFLHFMQFSDGAAIDHALSSGRIAFGCKSVSEVFSKVSVAGGTVQTPPLVLSTPGKNDVVVTILVDPDGYEICFVEDTAFYELATPTFDVVDFAERASRGGDGVGIQRGRQNTDGVSKESGDAAGNIRDGKLLIIESDDDFNSLLSRVPNDVTVIADFGASWCKNCKKLAPAVKSLAVQHKETVVVLDVDIDDCEDIAEEWGVSSIPRLIAFRGGSKVGDYVGSNVEEVTSFFQSHQ